jgi:hypothetical protein
MKVGTGKLLVRPILWISRPSVNKGAFYTKTCDGAVNLFPPSSAVVLRVSRNLQENKRDLIENEVEVRSSFSDTKTGNPLRESPSIRFSKGVNL